MKKTVIIILVLLFSINISAQKGQIVLGVNLAPNTTKIIDYEPYTFGLGGGFYFDYQFFRGIGFSTGVNYLPINFTDKNFASLHYVGCCPERVNYTFNVIEIPLKLSIKLNPKEDAKYKFYLTGGYSLGRIINLKYESIFSDREDVTFVKLNEDENWLNIFNAGFEVRYSIKGKYQISVGTNFKYTYRENIMDKVYNFNLMLKFGKILN